MRGQEIVLESTWKRTFFTIWGGQAISLLTSAIVQYALLWQLTAQTKSAVVLSIAALLGFLPTALFSPFIGSYVDKHNRKMIMMVADALIAASTAVLVVIGLYHEIPILLIYVTLFIRAMGSAFHQPCLQAVTPLIVPKDQLAKCGGYTSTFQSISFILSPALAASMFAVLPLSFILSLDIIGAAIGIFTIAISKIPRLLEEEKKKMHVMKDTLEGLRILQKEKGLYYLVFLVALCYVAYIPVSSLYPLMTVSYFGGTIADAGLAETAFAIGMLVGGLILGVWGGTKDKMKTIVVSVFVLGLTTLFMGLLSPSGFILFVSLSAMTGFAVPFFSSLFMSIIQEKIQPEYLGRVLGVAMSMMALAAPIGLALSGLFAEKIGIQNWFGISGIVTFVCVALCLMIKSVRNIDKRA